MTSYKEILLRVSDVNRVLLFFHIILRRYRVSVTLSLFSVESHRKPRILGALKIPCDPSEPSTPTQEKPFYRVLVRLESTDRYPIDLLITNTSLQSIDSLLFSHDVSQSIRYRCYGLESRRTIAAGELRCSDGGNCFYASRVEYTATFPTKTICLASIVIQKMMLLVGIIRLVLCA